MLLPVVVEQQAELGVSAEESKAQRLKRQQARFRDRGGAFVPSNTNPLVDILLARTVSGESPSKARPKDVTAKRISPSKARRTSSTRKAGAVTASDESQAVAGSSKSKLPAPRKRKEKAVPLEADTITKPAPKRRGRPAKGKKKAPDADSDTEKPPPNTKSKSTSKGKGKRRDTSTAPTTSDGNSKPKPKAKPKSNPAKTVVEVLVSDDDRTLVEVPYKAKSNSKRNIRYEDDGETDDDAPIVRKRVLPPKDDSQASGTKTATRVKAEKIAGMGSSGKKMEEGKTTVQNSKCPKTNSKKRVPRGDDDDDGVTAPAAKKGKAVSAKPKIFIEPSPRTTKDVKNGEKSRTTGHGRGKGRAEPDQDIVKPAEEDNDERPPECTSKPKKRKKEEDNYDDRPRKAVKFSDTDHPSSQKLKENQSDRKRKNISKSSARDEPDAPRPKLATKPPPRAKGSKGPPREVLERIKASAVRHLQCADSEPDELDCLS